LRFIALLFFVVALFFGSFLRVNTGQDVAGGEQILATGPVWEGWVEPPAHTGKPSIYLNDIPAGRLRVPQGSMLTLRLYGDVGALTVAETVSGRVGEIGVASDAQQKFAINQSGNLAIEGENGAAWDISVAIDQPPLVELTGPVESDAEGEMAQPFLALDDYGVVSGTATIALDLGAVDRAHGLAVDPDGFEELVLDLERIREKTKFEKAHFAGHSLGGMIAPAYALKFPEHTISVGLLSTVAGRSEEDSKKVWNVIHEMEKNGIEKTLQTLTTRWFTDEFINNNSDLVERRLKQVVDTDPEVFLNVFKI
jgi:hypothetical protein